MSGLLGHAVDDLLADELHDIAGQRLRIGRHTSIHLDIEDADYSAMEDGTKLIDLLASGRDAVRERGLREQRCEDGEDEAHGAPPKASGRAVPVRLGSPAVLRPAAARPPPTPPLGRGRGAARPTKLRHAIDYARLRARDAVDVGEWRAFSYPSPRSRE